MLGLVQWIVGTVLYLAAALVVFALGERLGSPWHGLALAATVLLLLPALMTSWFVRAYSRLDTRSSTSTTTWRQNFPGICAITSAVTLLLLVLIARGAVADSLERSTAQRPAVAHVAARPVHTVVAWLRAANAPAASASSAPPLTADTGTVRASGHPHVVSDRAEDRSSDAGARVVITVHRDHPPAVSPHETLSPVATPEPVDPGEALGRTHAPAALHQLVLHACGHEPIREVAMIPTHAGMPDRVWAGCLGDKGELYGIRADGGVSTIATVRLPATPPDAQSSYVAHAEGADLDRDGATDLVVCAQYLSERGGSRGGTLAWARARPDGGYAPLQRIATATCSGFAVADLDGAPGPEIVLVDYGNAYAPDPRGRLVILTGRGGNWHSRWSMPIAREPEHFALRDVDGDGHLDAVIDHDDGVGVHVYPGHGLAFSLPDPGLNTPAPHLATSAEGDLDGDGTRDDRVEVSHGALRLRRGHEMQRADAPVATELVYPAQATPQGQPVASGAVRSR